MGLSIPGTNSRPPGLCLGTSSKEPDVDDTGSGRGDSWNRDLGRAFDKSDPTRSSTWLQPDASATPLPEPGPAPALKPPAEGVFLAEPYKVIGEVGRGG